MFKNIPLKKARTITAIICAFIGIICVIIYYCSHDFVLDTFIFSICMGIALSISLYMLPEITIFLGRDVLEKNVSYAQSLLSTEEYRKINLKLENNEFLKVSVEESPISYYAKIKSDKEIEISIRKDKEEISNKTINLSSFRRFFEE